MPEIIAEKYEVLETIGRGGMGTVYKARQTNLDRIVAIKMLSEELAADPEFRARFQQEATVVARLNHSNIVQIFDIEPHNNTFCIIMEYVDGENLQAKIDRDVTLPEAEVVEIGAQVAEALAYAHSRGVIHRDIKPDNIHVTPKGVAKVMDFGIARYTDSKLKTQTGISMGTPKFMSPEQVTGKNVDGQTDLYSLGVCLYYCLAGRPPFDGENAISVATRHLYEQPEPPSKLNSSISPAVEKVILHSMEKQKQNRYGTGVEMAAALRASLAMKTPVRAVWDAEEKFGKDATLKMPSQGFGGSGVTPIPPAPVQAEPAEDAVVNGSAAKSANLTPINNRNVPQLDPQFRTPRAELKSDVSASSFRRSLLIFGSMVVLAAALLVGLVVWLRSGGTPEGNGTAEAAGNTAVQTDWDRLQQGVEKELASGGGYKGALRLAREFQQRNPTFDNARMKTFIDSLESNLPVSEGEALRARRTAMAREYSWRGVVSMARAYNEAAGNPTSNEGINALSRFGTITPQNVADAETTFSAAISKAGAQKRDGMIGAIELNSEEPGYWMALGDYFSSANLRDDARVMYMHAQKLTKDATQRVALDQKLKELEK